MAGADGDDSLYPIAVLIDELRNEDVQVVTIISTSVVVYIVRRIEVIFTRFIGTTDYQLTN